MQNCPTELAIDVSFTDRFDGFASAAFV
jgi:hypothetical protein